MRQWVSAVGLRFGAGHGLWSLAAFLFPSLALARGEPLSVAMGLFLLETLAAVTLLSARLGVAWLATRNDPDARAPMRRVVHGLWGVLLMTAIAAGYGLAVVVGALYVEGAEEAWPELLARGRWLLVVLTGTAVLDSIVAPVRAPRWLETNLAWQASRSSVLVVSILLGIPLALWMRSPVAFVWPFLGLRLIADVGGLRASERERIRSLMFDAPDRASTPGATGTPTAPPAFSRRHARYDVNDPRRLP